MTSSDLFNLSPKVKPRRNILPINPEKQDPKKAVGSGRFPSWLHKKLPSGNELEATSGILQENRLHTVCEEARCPNLSECWSQGTATFLIMGKECTRSCGFCNIDFSKDPSPLDPLEPQKVADSVVKLGLKHVVITMVARDDLPDGGAAHLTTVLEVIRQASPSVTLEVLTSDFAGNYAAWDRVIEAKPRIFNHNIETVRSLTPRVRHKATYDRTMTLLSYVRRNSSPQEILLKSGLMVGLGESEEEVKESIDDLYKAGCTLITIGQYLQPNGNKLRVKEFVAPEQFHLYEEYGKSIGVPHMYCGPFVRSSYHADEILTKASS